MVKKPTKAERIEIMKNYKPSPERKARELKEWEDAMFKNEYSDVLSTEECLIKVPEKSK